MKIAILGANPNCGNRGVNGVTSKTLCLTEYH